MEKVKKISWREHLISPHFLLISTLLFWGQQTRLLSFAIPMCLILEASRWIKWRWHFEDKEVNRIADFTSILSLLIILYLFSQQSIHGLFTLVKWLPILFFLIVITQVYSTSSALKLSSLFISLRKARGIQKQIDIRFPYMVLCLLSASVNNASGFFIGMCVLTSWALWTIRPKRYSLFIWLPLLMISVSLATMGYMGLHEFQKYLESAILSWFEDRIWDTRDPYRQNTAIGDIGSLKLSDRIVLRVKSPAPILLRESSYDAYFKTLWRAKQADFKSATVAYDDTTWTFSNSNNSNHLQLQSHQANDLQPDESIIVSRYLTHGKGMLALPNGTYQLTNFMAQDVQYNDFGAVKVELGPDLIEYRAHFNQNTVLDKMPSAQDLDIPRDEENHLKNLAHSLHLQNHTPRQRVATVAQFFNQNFKYSLELESPKDNHLTPLAYFLYNKKQGHCEYFATATVLLLRAANIPARYAAGYAVEEYSPLEKQYVARRRHAHAWTLAYIDGQWQNVDTTPAIWAELEKESSPWWTSVYDFAAWANFAFSKWRWQESGGMNPYLLWLILPLSLILVWRLYLKKRVAHVKKQHENKKNMPTTLGADSPFYAIISEISGQGYARLQGETLESWFKRVNLPQTSHLQMKTVIFLHQRYRFDPQSISVEEKTLLQKEVEKWLEKYRTFSLKT